MDSMSPVNEEFPSLICLLGITDLDLCPPGYK